MTRASTPKIRRGRSQAPPAWAARQARATPSGRERGRSTYATASPAAAASAESVPGAAVPGTVVRSTVVRSTVVRGPVAASRSVSAPGVVTTACAARAAGAATR